MLVGNLLLLNVLLVARKRLLVADVQAVADQRVGIDIGNRVAMRALDELVARKPGEHRLALGGVGRADIEAGSRKLIFLVRHLLALRHATGKRDREDTRRNGRNELGQRSGLRYSPS